MTIRDRGVVRPALGAAAVLLALFFYQSEAFAHARLLAQIRERIVAEYSKL